jgi:hypothetical protein
MMAWPKAQPLQRKLERIGSRPANPDTDHFHDRASPNRSKILRFEFIVRVTLRSTDVD